MNFFDYLNSINYSKKDIMVDDIAEDQYNSFMINRGLSYFQDTVIYANEMNKYHHLDSRLQFDFFINTIRKRKRYSKWAKTANSENLSVVKEYYGYSNQKAQEALSLLSNEHINELKKRIFKGGRK